MVDERLFAEYAASHDWLPSLSPPYPAPRAGSARNASRAYFFNRVAVCEGELTEQGIRKARATSRPPSPRGAPTAVAWRRTRHVRITRYRSV